MLGFNEKLGLELEKQDYCLRNLKDFFRKHQFIQISIPIIEPASSFSESVVGKSPWPEWNERGCFYLTIEDYSESYDDQPKLHPALLIPEGTIPITRWLGESLDQGRINLPLKVFYELSCFRNELVSTLSETKRREFSQFGMEIMGSADLRSDILTIYLVAKAIERLGVPSRSVRIRCNDVSIFNQLILESGLSEHRILIKEALDSLAEVKAGKGVERREGLLETLNRKISVLPPETQRKWTAIIDQSDYQMNHMIEVLGPAYEERLRQLIRLQEAFRQQPYNINLDLDACVIRSHEYYTDISFEVDVIGAHSRYVEIAGGGRYNRLVENFISSDKIEKTVPCVGFAFGLERLLHLLDVEDLFRPTTLTSIFRFDEPHEDSFEVGALNFQDFIVK